MKRFSRALVLGLAACSSATRLKLPDTGLARAPDGRVAFVRATPTHLVATSLGEEQATELWIANPDGTHARRLLVGNASDSVPHALALMTSPLFSPDGRYIYFLSRAWVTSDAVHAIDVATGQERYIAAGNTLAIIPRGPLAGCLLVGQHRYWPQGRSYDWEWLLTGKGQEITLAATDSDGASERLATWMSGAIPARAFQASGDAPPNVRCN